MSTYDIIREEDYDDLPEDNEPRFVALETICRRNLNAMIDEQTSGNFDQTVRLLYMTTVSAAATELGIPNLRYPRDIENEWQAFTDFSLRVSGEVTKIRLRNLGRNKPFSVSLSPKAKGVISLQLDEIRKLIASSDLSPSRKKRALEKLDQLKEELESKRVRFDRLMAIMLQVSLIGGESVSLLANINPAIATVIHWVGKDKEAEDRETLRLTQPILAISAPVVQTRGVKPTFGGEAFSDDLDNDVPF